MENKIEIEKDEQVLYSTEINLKIIPLLIFALFVMITPSIMFFCGAINDAINGTITLFKGVFVFLIELVTLPLIFWTFRYYICHISDKMLITDKRIYWKVGRKSDSINIEDISRFNFKYVHRYIYMLITTRESKEYKVLFFFMRHNVKEVTDAINAACNKKDHKTDASVN